MYSLFISAVATAIFTVLSFAEPSSRPGPQAKCFYPPNPDPFYQPNDTPCNPSAKNSNCCARDDVCLSNGLCWRADINRLHRGSCTDPTWQAPECTRICTTPGTHDFGWADVLQCPDFSNRWYCNLGNASTCETKHTISLVPGYSADFRINNAHAPSSQSHATSATVTVTTCPAGSTQLPTAVLPNSESLTSTIVTQTATPITSDNATTRANGTAVTTPSVSAPSVLPFSSSSAAEAVSPQNTVILALLIAISALGGYVAPP